MTHNEYHINNFENKWTRATCVNLDKPQKYNAIQKEQAS